MVIALFTSIDFYIILVFNVYATNNIQLEVSYKLQNNRRRIEEANYKSEKI